jgi:hypothetical protein
LKDLQAFERIGSMLDINMADQGLKSTVEDKSASKQANPVTGQSKKTTAQQSAFVNPITEHATINFGSYSNAIASLDQNKYNSLRKIYPIQKDKSGQYFIDITVDDAFARAVEKLSNKKPKFTFSQEKIAYYIMEFFMDFVKADKTFPYNAKVIGQFNWKLNLTSIKSTPWKSTKYRMILRDDIKTIHTAMIGYNRGNG